MNANAARKIEPSEDQMTNPFSGESFKVIDGGTPAQSTKEFKPKNPLLEKREKNEAAVSKLRTLVADALSQHNQTTWSDIDDLSIDPSQPLDVNLMSGAQIDELFQEIEVNS